MADKVVKMDLSYVEEGDVTGKVVNVYDTYTHALGHSGVGLASSLKAVDPLTGTPTGSAITQVAKETGINIDNNGKLLCSLDDSNPMYYGAVVSGRQVGPFQIVM